MVGILPTTGEETCFFFFFGAKAFSLQRSIVNTAGRVLVGKQALSVNEYEVLPLQTRGRRNSQPLTATPYPKTPSEFHVALFPTKHALLKLSLPDGSQLGVKRFMGLLICSPYFVFIFLLWGKKKTFFLNAAHAAFCFSSQKNHISILQNLCTIFQIMVSLPLKMALFFEFMSEIAQPSKLTRISV